MKTALEKLISKLNTVKKTSVNLKIGQYKLRYTEKERDKKKRKEKNRSSKSYGTISNSLTAMVWIRVCLPRVHALQFGPTRY